MQKCFLLVDAMNEMHLGKRERGSKDGACKHQTLLGRYFKKEIMKEPEKKENHELNFIEQGSVISILKLKDVQ